MKINFQKILATVSAVAVIFCFAVPASATSSSVTGGITAGGGGSGGNRTEYGNVLSVYAETLGDYVNGNITIDELLTKSNAIISENEISDRLGIDTIIGITEGIERTVEKFGDNASTYISQWIDDYFDDYRQLADIESPDNPSLNGYSAMIVLWRNREKGLYTCYYSNNGGIVYDETYQLITYDYYEDYQYFNKVFEDTASGNSHNFAKVGLTGVQDYEIFGNWSTSDGSEAETNDKYTQEEVLNFTNTSDSELDMLLQAILEQLKRQNPDLSSLEGLLESIYYRLGQLDSDNDNGLLSQVLVAIQSLQGTNSEMLGVLEEIKEELTDGKNDDNSELAEKLENMITVMDFEIDEDLYRNHSEVLKLRLQEKFIFAEQLKELVIYSVNSYRRTDETPEMQVEHNGWFYSINFDIYEEYMPTIRFMIAAFTYISFALHTYRKIPSYINGGDNL